MRSLAPTLMAAQRPMLLQEQRARQTLQQTRHQNRLRAWTATELAHTLHPHNSNIGQGVPNAGAAGAANAGAADALANAGAPTPPKIGGLLDVPNAGAGALGKTLAAGGEAPNAVGDCDGDVPNTVLEVAGMPNGLVLNAFADEGAANGLAAVLTGEDAAGGIALPNALEGLD